MRRARRFLTCSRGSTAVEFALVLPVMVLLAFGGIMINTMMYANIALNFAAQDAARCMAIKTLICPGTSVQTYGSSKYVGPALASLTFTGSAPTCGRQVVATGTYTLRTGLASVSVPMRATACYAA
jgi:Flp pilus assembly protein TadG